MPPASASGGDPAAGGQDGDGGSGGAGGALPESPAASGGSTSSDGNGGTTQEPGTGGSGTGGSDTGEPDTIDPGPFDPNTLPFFVGNITTRDSVDTDGLVYADYWDQITPENAGKWGSVQQSPGSPYRWSTLDAIYDYAQDHQLIFKQHAFVWGSMQPGGNIGEADLRDWMKEFCARYPNTPLIDVVNEPPPHTTPSYVNAIGGGTNGNWAWIANSFKWAREYCPNSILILNDYNMIEWNNDANHIISIVKAIQEAGAPIDALGSQCHDLDHGSVSLQTVQSLLQRVHDETGLPVYITEMDISTDNDQTQLELYQRYFQLFREKDFVKGITIWGWIYGKTWSHAAQSGLIRNGAPRPAMTWLMGELGRPVP